MYAQERGITAARRRYMGGFPENATGNTSARKGAGAASAKEAFRTVPPRSGANLNAAIRAHAYFHWVPNCRSGDIGLGWRLVANIAGVYVVGRRRHLPHQREKYGRLLIRTTMMRGRLAVVGRGGDLFGIRVAGRNAIDISDDWAPVLTRRCSDRGEDRGATLQKEDGVGNLSLGFPRQSQSLPVV